METKDLVDTAPIAQLVDNIGAKSVFGEPTTEDGVVIIPVAQVEYGFGYGGGYGVNPDADGAEDSGEGDDGADQEAETEGTSGEGGGGGGGAAGRATPRGFIRITPEAVSYEAISDDERIPLAGILMVAWSVFWIALTIRTLIKSVARVKQAQG